MKSFSLRHMYTMETHARESIYFVEAENIYYEAETINVLDERQFLFHHFSMQSSIQVYHFVYIDFELEILFSLFHYFFLFAHNTPEEHMKEVETEAVKFNGANFYAVKQ